MKPTAHILIAVLASMPAMAQEILPKPPTPFAGTIDASRQKSHPAWPGEVTAPAGAPNVVLILLDDVGFGASSAMGGAVPTPALDRLARDGLRYNNFHVNAMCSPTRGALLSGRNNHEVGFGPITESAAGYPGYNSVWPRSAASIAEVLKDNGYSTAAFGKWHNTPTWEVNATGPFDRWPTSLGFDYYYGFMSAATSQWEPSLYRDTVAVEPPATPAQGYNLNHDLANDAIHWLHQHDAIAPERPFFLYYATGATHQPHQVPQNWIDKFRGKFDTGWDSLRAGVIAGEKKAGTVPANADTTPRPAELPAWDSLSADAKKLYAHQMEVYAGFLAQTDYEVGRVIDAIREEGRADNTLVFYIAGDNGATEEAGTTGGDLRRGDGEFDPVDVQLARADKLGSPLLNNNYAAGWAYALNSPFPWSKQVASHLGGITDPLIVSWPARIQSKGEIRNQFGHIVDIAPTIYAAAGIHPPDIVNGTQQTKLEGASLLPTFADASVKTAHTTQYFELIGNRGIYNDGWFAGRRFLLPWQSYRSDMWAANDPDRLHPWELYNLNTDFAQAHNLADQEPQKLAGMIALYDSEARRNNAYPTAPLRLPQPSPAIGKTSFTYREGVVRLPLRSAPSIGGRSHIFSADLDLPSADTQGVVFAEGGRYGGFALYVRDHHLVYENNAQGRAHDKIISTDALPVGRVHVTYRFTADPQKPGNGAIAGVYLADGQGELLVNDTVAGRGQIHQFGAFGGETFDIGNDFGSPVSVDYQTPFSFDGHIEKVTLDIK
jgi:arylsulfatase A-like enzyme